MHHHSIVGLLDKTPKLPNETYVYMLLFEKLRDPVTFSTYEIAGSRNLVVQISQKGMQDMIFGEMGRVVVSQTTRGARREWQFARSPIRQD